MDRPEALTPSRTGVAGRHAQRPRFQESASLSLTVTLLPEACLAAASAAIVPSVFVASTLGTGAKMQKDQRKRSHAGASTASTHNDEPDVDDCWPLHVPLAVRGGRSTKTEAREIDIWNLPDRPDVPVDDAIGLPQLIGTRKPRKRSSSAPIVVAYGGAEPAEGYFDGGNWGDSRARVTSGRYARARRAGAQAAHGRSAEEAEPLLRATISEDNNGGVHAAEQETDGEAPPTTCDDMCGGFALGKAGEATAKVRQDKEKKREERWQMRSFRALFARLSFILPALIRFGDSMQQSNTCAPVELMFTDGPNRRHVRSMLSHILCGMRSCSTRYDAPAFTTKT